MSKGIDLCVWRRIQASENKKGDINIRKAYQNLSLIAKENGYEAFDILPNDKENGWCVPHSHCEFMNKNACCEMCEGNHRNYSGVARVDCKCHSTPAPVKEECNHPEIVAQTVKIVE